MCALLQFTQLISDWAKNIYTVHLILNLVLSGENKESFQPLTTATTEQSTCASIKVDRRVLKWSTWHGGKGIIALVFVNTKEITLFIRQKQLVIYCCRWGRSNWLAKFLTLKHQLISQPPEPVGLQNLYGLQFYIHEENMLQHKLYFESVRVCVRLPLAVSVKFHTGRNSGKGLNAWLFNLSWKSFCLCLNLAIAEGLWHKWVEVPVGRGNWNLETRAKILV